MSQRIAKFLSAAALTFVLVASASADAIPVTPITVPAAPPSATVTLGPVGNPATKNYVRADGTWADCGNATGATITLYKGTVANKAAAVNVGQLSASPAGAQGKLGGDMSDPTKYKSGDTVFAVITIVDANGVVITKTTADYTVP